MNRKSNFQPKIIPVEYYKENLLNTVKKFQIIIVQAETGSGKTIYIPKILHATKIFKKLIISQTKRTSAIGAATFLSTIFEEKIGALVGYSVRFDRKSSSSTKIKFVTDGILFQKLINNFFFDKDTCIILDEFHERTLNTDLLICLLKQALILRKDLKLIFMSASGDSFKLAHYFQKKIGKIDIPGSIYKITTFYTKYPQLDFIVSLCSAIISFHLLEKLNGDFLIFLPGYGEILECEKTLLFQFKKKCDNFSINKLHSNIPLSEQLLIFNSLDAKKRKIILSTNIAESSLTIKGIKFVFDCGLSKQKILNWKSGLDLYKISPISKSEAKQRAGRAGRISNGKCLRLFTYIEYTRFQNFPKPEIQRSELSSLFLHILTSKFPALFNFEFVDLPPSWLIKRSIEKLFVLGAIDEKINLTWIGKLLSVYPIEIRLSKCLVQSLITQSKKIKYYTILSCSMLSINCNFYLLDSISTKKPFRISNINEECFLAAIILEKFLSIKDKPRKRLWCKIKKVDFYTFELAEKIYKQLFDINKLSNNYFFFPKDDNNNTIHNHGIYDGIRFCFTSGFFKNSCRIVGNTGDLQIITTGILVNIKRFNKKSKYISNLFLFFELLISHQTCIRGLTSTKLPWLLYFGKRLFY